MAVDDNLSNCFLLRMQETKLSSLRLFCITVYTTYDFSLKKNLETDIQVHTFRLK